jgi:ubiquitin carboxyl-terminal hydrolase 12/46
LTPPSLQDAHEFLNYLLNQVGEGLEKQQKQGALAPADDAPSNGSSSNGSAQQQPASTWVHDIFQGRLVSETRCLQCETITSREEVFVDLSLEIDQNCSLTSCLKQFRWAAPWLLWLVLARACLG